MCPVVVICADCLYPYQIKNLFKNQIALKSHLIPFLSENLFRLLKLEKSRFLYVGFYWSASIFISYAFKYDS